MTEPESTPRYLLIAYDLDEAGTFFAAAPAYEIRASGRTPAEAYELLVQAVRRVDPRAPLGVQRYERSPRYAAWLHRRIRVRRLVEALVARPLEALVDGLGLAMTRVPHRPEGRR